MISVIGVNGKTGAAGSSRMVFSPISSTGRRRRCSSSSFITATTILLWCALLGTSCPHLVPVTSAFV